MASSKPTFTLKVYNNRGKLIDSRETTRGNQRYAHRLARVVIRDFPSGTRLVLSNGPKVVEEFKMHPDGYTFEVLNGDNVQAASRQGESRRASIPAQRSAPKAAAKASKTAVAPATKRPVRKVRKTATKKATAKAPF